MILDFFGRLSAFRANGRLSMSEAAGFVYLFCEHFFKT
jgi:hypothetical protein